MGVLSNISLRKAFQQLGIVRANNASTIPSAAPAGGTGTAAGGYDTAGNRDAMIATVNGLRTAVSALKTEHNDLLDKLRSAGIIQ